MLDTGLNIKPESNAFYLIRVKMARETVRNYGSLHHSLHTPSVFKRIFAIAYSG